MVGQPDIGRGGPIVIRTRTLVNPAAPRGQDRRLTLGGPCGSRGDTLLPPRPPSHLQRLDEWIRRKPRCLRLKQCKRAKATADFLHGLGAPEWRAWMPALTGTGRWRMALGDQATEAMTLAWFKRQGLVPVTGRYLALQTEGNRRGT